MVDDPKSGRRRMERLRYSTAVLGFHHVILHKTHTTRRALIMNCFT
jgi:hypothetical protein